MLLLTEIEQLKQHLIAKQKSPETVRGYTMDLNHVERNISEKGLCT